MKKILLISIIFTAFISLSSASDAVNHKNQFVLKYTGIDLNDEYDAVIINLKNSGVSYYEDEGNIKILGELTGDIKADYINVIFNKNKASNIIIKYNKKVSNFKNISDDIKSILPLKSENTDSSMIWTDTDYTVELYFNDNNELILHYYLNGAKSNEFSSSKFALFSFGGEFNINYNLAMPVYQAAIMYSLDFAYSYTYFFKNNAGLGYTIDLGARLYLVWAYYLYYPDIFLKIKMTHKFGKGKNKAYFEHGIMILYKIAFPPVIGIGAGPAVSIGYEYTARNNFSVSIGANIDFAFNAFGYDGAIGAEIKFKYSIKKYRK